MAAEKGNRYAQKWTRENVLSVLTQMDEDKVGCLFLGELLVKHSLYKDIWVYWKETFGDDDEVFRTMKIIDQFFESQLFGMALRNKTNATMAIFGLKNNHGWVDKIHSEVTGKDGSELIPPTKMSDDELRKAVESILDQGPADTAGVQE